MDYITSLLVSTNKINENYNLILIIIDYSRNIINDKPVKILIYISELVLVFINMIVHHYDIFELIILY